MTSRLLVFLLLLPLPQMLLADIDPRPRADAAALGEAVDTLRRQHDLPGVAVALFDRENIRVIAAGAGVDGDTPFRLGAVGELLVAGAVLLLAEDGSLSLDAPVLTLAPELDLRNDWYEERPVTVDDLLLHRSGLARPHFRDVVMPREGQALLAAINRSFRSGETAFRPGTRFNHSALNTAIAAYVAEQAAAGKLQDIIDAMFNAPLGISLRIGEPAEPGAVGHDVDGRPMEPLPLNLRPAGDWWGSARDLALLGQLLLNRGMQDGRRLLSPTLVEALEGPDGLPLGQRRGLALELPDGNRMHVMRGRLPGFRASLAYLPERDGGFVVLVNRGGDGVAIRDFETLLRGQLPPRAPAEGLGAGDVPPASLEGFYRRVGAIAPVQQLLLDVVGPLRARRCEDSLCIDAPGLPAQRLVAVGDAGELRAREAWLAEWRWADIDGEIRLWNPASQWRQVDHLTAWWPMIAVLLLLPASLLAVVQLLRLPMRGWRHRAREDGWLELLPAALAGGSVLGAMLVPLLFQSMDLPSLAVPGVASSSLLIASITGPVFALLAIPAYLVARYRRHLYAPWRTGASLLAGLGWAALLLAYDLVAFQTWNW